MSDGVFDSADDVESYNSFTHRDALDSQLADDVAAILTKAVNKRGKATLVVSGGSTPLQFFKFLSEKELPWADITVTLADERWVNPDHADSNEKLVRENLLVGKAAAGKFLPLKTSHTDANDGQAELDAELAALGRFDLVILGMGGDGHTASLFPKAKALKAAVAMDSGKNCLAIDPVTAPHQRMTMTLPRLLNSRKVFIHITGQEKKAILQDAGWRIDPAEQRELPISFILQQEKTPVSIYWAE